MARTPEEAARESREDRDILMEFAEEAPTLEASQQEEHEEALEALIADDKERRAEDAQLNEFGKTAIEAAKQAAEEDIQASLEDNTWQN